MSENKVVMAFCAHNDDHIIGAGGTLASYVKKGTDVVTVIFSYGESTHPWLKEQEVIKMRVEESQKADKVIGADKLYYLGLKEGSFLDELKSKKGDVKIKRMINMLRPTKIFTHSEDDPHPDHRAVNTAVMQITESIRHKCDIYSFDIWNPFNVRHRDRPKMVVDVTKTFPTKVKAIKEHESQWLALAMMIPATYIRALVNGLDKGYRYAEVFAKLR